MPSLDPALVGTWTGEILEPRGLSPNWRAMYVLRPCDGDGTCGTWDMRAVVIREDPNYPWAVKGTELRCAGSIGFTGLHEEALVFVQTTREAEPRESESACGSARIHLTPTADGALDYVMFVWGNVVMMRGTLHAADASPAPSESATRSVADSLVGIWIGT